jgi:hypothetical protein
VWINKVRIYSHGSLQFQGHIAFFLRMGLCGLDVLRIENS